MIATENDAQIDWTCSVMLELARQVRAGKLSGHFAVEFSAHKGEIKTVHNVARVPKEMPLRSGKK